MIMFRARRCFLSSDEAPFLLCRPAADSRCECSGRAWRCLQDAWGLRCLDCQGNTEGRRCERCKDGFYQQGARLSCTPCNCNPTGEDAPVRVTSSSQETSERVFSLQVQLATRVTAGGAAAVRKASLETNVTFAPTARWERTAAAGGDVII